MALAKTKEAERLAKMEKCVYCDGSGVGDYWVHDLSETVDFTCHICDGHGVAKRRDNRVGREQKRTP
jgi:DnaJ-class molecular chaperone